MDTPNSQITATSPKPHEPEKQLTPPHRLKWYVALGVLGQFTNGWVDAAMGPLILSWQGYYGVSYGRISLYAITYATGWTLGSFFTQFCVDRLGFGISMLVGNVMMLVATGLFAAPVPYGVFLASWWLLGVGILTVAGQLNYIGGRLGNAEYHISWMNAGWGVGAICSTIIGALMVQNIPSHFQRFYLCQLGVLLISTSVVAAIFGFKRVEDLVILDTHAPRPPPTSTRETFVKMLRLVRMRKMQYLMAVGILMIGMEYVMFGWTVAYVGRVKHGGPKSGYVATAIFAGYAIGRSSLPPLTRKLGIKNAFALYLLVFLGFEVVFWRTSPVWLGGVCFGIIGIVFGTFFPILIHVAGVMLEPDLFAGSIGAIFTAGGFGVGAFPYIVGPLADHFGLQVVPILLLIMGGLLLALWGFAPFLGVFDPYVAPLRGADEEKTNGDGSGQDMVKV